MRVKSGFCAAPKSELERERFRPVLSDMLLTPWVAAAISIVETYFGGTNIKYPLPSRRPAKPPATIQLFRRHAVANDDLMELIEFSKLRIESCVEYDAGGGHACCQRNIDRALADFPRFRVGPILQAELGDGAWHGAVDPRYCYATPRVSHRRIRHAKLCRRWGSWAT